MKTKWVKIFLVLMVGLSACQAGNTLAPPATKDSAPPSTPFSPFSSTPSPSPTFSPINVSLQLFWFYKPPDETITQPVALNFDLFILTHKDEDDREALRALGATVPFFQYLLLLEIHDPGSCTAKPFGNQVAYKAGDFCQISQQHPDWFLLDQKGRRISFRKGYWLMDPGNGEYRAFWLTRAREMLLEFGWDGIFIDNVEASLGKFRREGISLGGYPQDSDWQHAMEEFLAYLRSHYFQPAQRPLFANVVSMNDTETWQQYVALLDGVMIEHFATGWENAPLSAAEWETQMSLAEWALAHGKTLLLVSQGEKNDLERQNFALASYWLLQNGHAYFRYANSDEYNAWWNYPNYAYNLGAALGPRFQEGDVWQRPFENGTVIVNPHTGHATIQLSAQTSNMP